MLLRIIIHWLASYWSLIITHSHIIWLNWPGLILESSHIGVLWGHYLAIIIGILILEILFVGRRSILVIHHIILFWNLKHATTTTTWTLISCTHSHSSLTHTWLRKLTSIEIRLHLISFPNLSSSSIYWPLICRHRLTHIWVSSSSILLWHCCLSSRPSSIIKIFRP